MQVEPLTTHDAPPTLALVVPETPSAALGAVPANPVAVYLAGLGNDRSRQTMYGYLKQLARFMTGNDEALPERDVPWHTLRYVHVSAIRSALTDKLHYKPKSANTALAALRGVLKACWRLGLMTAEEYHTARSVDAVTGETLPAGREITAGERAALFAICAADPSAAGRRDAALVALLYACMLRRAEASSLDLENYDREQGRFRIVGKRRKERFIYVTASGVAEALDDWLVVRAQALPADSGPLFVPTGRGGRIQVRFSDGETLPRLSAHAIYATLERRRQQAGIAVKLTPHDFRRTGIGDLLDAGIDLALVSRLVGHSQVETTAKYDRRPEEAKRKAASALHVPYVRRAG